MRRSAAHTTNISTVSRRTRRHAAETTNGLRNRGPPSSIAPLSEASGPRKVVVAAVGLGATLVDGPRIEAHSPPRQSHGYRCQSRRRSRWGRDGRVDRESHDRARDGHLWGRVRAIPKRRMAPGRAGRGSRAVVVVVPSRIRFDRRRFWLATRPRTGRGRQGGCAQGDRRRSRSEGPRDVTPKVASSATSRPTATCRVPRPPPGRPAGR